MAPDMTKRIQEPLGLPRRGEAFHHPFADPGRLMRVLGPVVEVLRPAVLHRRHRLAPSDLVAAQFVGHQHPRHLLQALEQLPEKPLGRGPVSLGLHQDVEHLAVLVDRAPQVMGGAVDLDEHLIEMPLVAGAGTAPT